MRKYRSSRSRPSFSAFSTLTLVEDSSRKLGRRILVLPTGLNSRSCSTRSSLTCRFARELADFVEQQRAVVGHFHQAHLVVHRAGERAALVAEQLGLDQLGWGWPRS